MKYTFIHGLGQVPSSWNMVVANLSIHEQVDCPCLPFLLDGKQITYQNLFKAFKKRYSNEQTPFCLCGISLGAVLALQYAIDCPHKVKSLVLIAPQYKVWRPLLVLQNFLFEVMPRNAFLETGFNKAGMISLTNSMKSLDLKDKAKTITCPTLIVCGQNDAPNRSAAKKLSNIIPSAELVYIKSVGHEVNVEAPEILSRVIKRFWGVYIC